MNDEKFTNFSISIFERCNPGRNIFVIGRFSKHPKFEINESKNVNSFISGSREYFNFIDKSEFDVLIVHFLDYDKCKVIKKLKSGKTIVWLAWGGDIYNTDFYTFPLYQPYTKNLLKQINQKSNIKSKIKKRIRSIIYFLSIQKSPSSLYKSAVKEVSYCATVIPHEYKILTQWEFFTAKQVFFSYGSIEYDFKDLDLPNFKITGDSILIGNSISPTSNHLDVIEKLRNLEISDRKVVVPLNYGNEIEYRDKIIEEGKMFFGSNWFPLLNFMSKKEYIGIISECNIAIMNHERQQGIGNLILLFWLGCKIFLSERSIAYKYFKEKGFVIYSFQSDLNEESISIGLSETAIKKNRDLVKKEYSDDVVFRRAGQLLNTLKNNM